MLNLLRKTRVYLIGPMQYENGEGWRNKVKNILEPRGIVCFDPYHKPFLDDVPEDDATRSNILDELEQGNYEEVQERMWNIRGYDLRLVDISDFFIVNINPMTPTWGSVEEIVTAIRAKKSVFIVCESGKNKVPLWLFGMVPHKYIYGSMDEALKVITDIDDGIIKTDSDRWKLLKPEYR